MRTLSLRYKFIGISILTIVISLSLAGAVLMRYERESIRARIERALNTQAEMTDLNIRAALVFNDAKIAIDTLGSMRADPGLLAAWLYDKDSIFFASYSAERFDTPPPNTAPSSVGFSQTGNKLTIVRKISLDGTHVGILVLVTDLSIIDTMMRTYFLVIIFALGCSCLAAIIIASSLQRAVISRIQTLAENISVVAEGNAYDTRIDSGSMDELGILIHSFNRMAERIQNREAQINEQRDELALFNKELEKRVQDRTVQLEASNKELEASNRELEAFSYSVAHDLRAPLRHIDGFVDLLKKHIESVIDEKARRYLQAIGKSARDMGTLIDHLLIFSRMGKVALTMKKVNLTEIVEDIKKAIMQPDLQRSIRWRIETLPEIEADQATIRLVFENLMSNAVKYSRNISPATIEITCQEDEDLYTFCVSDNGAGFDQQYAAKLFGVFQRLHSSSEFEGTGIGLANVRRIVGRHGGTVWAKGEVNKGAQFFFTLPKTRIV